MASMMSGCGFRVCAVSLANYEGASLKAEIEKKIVIFVEPSRMEGEKVNNFALSQFDDLYKLNKGVSF